MKNIIYIFITAILLFSCKAKKATDNGSSADSLVAVIDSLAMYNNYPKDVDRPINTPIEFYQAVVPPLKFDQIKISSKLDIQTETQYLPTLDAVTYIENDSKIWMNISAFFITMARGVATPEGIKGYVKTEKKYIDSDFEYLNNLLNVNFFNFNTLEKLLMGRIFIRLNSNDFLFYKNAQGYKMNSIVNQRMETDSIVREYKVEMDYERNYDLKRVFLEDVNSLDQLEVTYDNWEEFSTYRMPKNVKILIKGSKNSQILIENTKFESKEMNTPFSIPKSYEQILIQ